MWVTHDLPTKMHGVSNLHLLLFHSHLSQFSWIVTSCGRDWYTMMARLIIQYLPKTPVSIKLLRILRSQCNTISVDERWFNSQFCWLHQYFCWLNPAVGWFKTITAITSTWNIPRNRLFNAASCWLPYTKLTICGCPQWKPTFFPRKMIKKHFLVFQIYATWPEGRWQRGSVWLVV